MVNSHRCRRLWPLVLWWFGAALLIGATFGCQQDSDDISQVLDSAPASTSTTSTPPPTATHAADRTEGDVDGTTPEDVDGTAIEDGTTGSSNEIADAARDRAPSWPFNGIINNSGNSLQYWNVDSDELSEVNLDFVGQWSCRSLPIVFEDHVEVGFLGVDYSIILVPWGDVAGSSSVSSINDFDSSTSLILGNGEELEVAYTASDLLSVRIAESVAYYEILSDRLVRIDRQLAEHRPAKYAESDLIVWKPLAYVNGTTSDHYGFRIVYREPACPAEMGFVVSSETGEIVVCGSIPGGGLGGPVLVSAGVENDKLRRVALPNPEISATCDGYLDLTVMLALPDIEDSSE